MSVSGAFVRTPVPAPAGAQVQLKLLTGGGAVPTVARVVRANSMGMGIRFEKADPINVPFDIPLDQIEID